MSGKLCSDEEFIRLFTSVGATQTSKLLGCSERAVYTRRSNLARFEPITAPSRQPTNFPGRVPIEIKNGTVLVGGDAHIWPGPASSATGSGSQSLGAVSKNSAATAAWFINSTSASTPRAR